MLVRDERNRKMHLESGLSSSDTSLLSLSYSMEMKNSRVDHNEFLALVNCYRHCISLEDMLIVMFYFLVEKQSYSLH